MNAKALYTLPHFVCLGLILAMPSSAGERDASLEPACPVQRDIDPVELKRELSTEVMTARGNVLLGVDVLGRIAIATDVDDNGLAEELLLFTDPERLQGPWSKYLQGARIHIRHGTVLITSQPDSFALSLAVSIAEPPAVPRWASNAVVRSAGRELARLSYGDAQTVLLDGLDHNTIQSWPQGFWSDSLDPGTGGCTPQMGQCCDDTECIFGGFPSSQCSISNCPGGGPIGSVAGCSGTNPAHFACCNCNGPGATGEGRCKACTCGPCP